MFLTHCVMGWTVLAVLSLCLPVGTALRVIQPYRVGSTNGTAIVKCFIQDQSPPNPDPEKLRVTLLKGLHGSHKVCSSTLSITDSKVEFEEGEGECSTEVREGALEVTVSGLKATDTDLYRCEIEVFYPPPYLLLTGNGTLIHVLDSYDCPVQGAQSETAQRGDDEEDGDGEEGTAPVSVPVVVLVILVMLVLIVIIYFQSVQCARGQREIVRSVPGGPHKVDPIAFSYNMA